MPSTAKPGTKPPRITFARVKATGSYTAMPSYTIKVNGSVVGHIQQKQSGKDSWFWYAAGRNTAATPTSFEQAMRQSAAHLRSLNAVNAPASTNQPPRAPGTPA